ncbi:amidohydrolase family protein [Phytohabitans sp. ZYX-F-186]|uniref:Amidohydrolase family protein n=1 Tax=Phytohabitans maris TaxID=3071409 RepID=A0ABU0ZRA6_9ACTN|nr:amidohydrolase family protein [Phytohabitans sp. ZYX-F-186]MDQ7909569.1 amidohydrolase family protein [Phytohabitans sp. ZYX-F-186]
MSGTGVDVHTHLAPALPRVYTVDGPPGLADPARLKRYLDTAGLAGAIVSVPPPYYRQDLTGDDGVEWSAAVNAGLAARIEGLPRLRGLAYLPLHDPAAALRAYQTVGDGEWVGVVAGAGGRCPSLADPAYEPLWRALDADGRALLLHPAQSPDYRLADFYLHNLLGNPVETAVAAAQLVFGNVLARHPGLKVVLVHGGGAVPALAGRWSRGVETARPGVPEQELGVRDALRRFWVDALTHDATMARVLVDVFGPDKVLLGSDWPFPMGTGDPAAALNACPALEGAGIPTSAGTTNAAAAFGWSGP